MTVVTKAQFDKIIADLPEPKNCDICGSPLIGDRATKDYGPFLLHVCADKASCAVNLKIRLEPRAGFEPA